ncbi:type II toxin-antitoxin system RelE/ParE family toxin [Candidatus Gottesmanbacteria bacterium]|nr:type II toxin-antitoxin system RelE/ParE family toxin [Candidatus Gottesmanbacteria bacterium]
MNLLITKRAQKELDGIPDPMAKNITLHILTLSTNPHPPNSKKLQGQDSYRLRVGSFRVIYTVDTKAKELTVLRVADRKTIYR